MASACALMSATEQMALQPSEANLRSRATTCIIASMSIICVCVLVVCGVMIAREYSLAAVYEMTSSCRLANITHDRFIQCMYCSSSKAKTNERGTAVNNCSPTQFPCVHIAVTFNVGGSKHLALLHPDSLQATGIHSQCSYSVCLKNKEDNEREVARYADVWRNLGGRQFDCYYDTETWDNVIVEKKYTSRDVIHSMFWPSAGLVACAVAFLVVETRRRGLTFCGRKDGAISGETTATDTTDTNHIRASSNDVIKASNSNHYVPPSVLVYDSVLETRPPGGGRAGMGRENHLRRDGVHCHLLVAASANMSKSMTSLDRIQNNKVAEKTPIMASGAKPARKPLPSRELDEIQRRRSRCRSNENVDWLKDNTCDVTSASTDRLTSPHVSSVIRLNLA